MSQTGSVIGGDFAGIMCGPVFGHACPGHGSTGTDAVCDDASCASGSGPREAQFLRRMPEAQSLRLDVVLPLRDQPGWINSYRRSTILPARLPPFPDGVGIYGPVWSGEEDYDALTRYAYRRISVVGGSRMEWICRSRFGFGDRAAFNVSMGIYQHPTENAHSMVRTRAHTGVAVTGVAHLGLDNYSIPRPMFVRKSDYAKARDIDPKT